MNPHDHPEVTMRALWVSDMLRTHPGLAADVVYFTVRPTSVCIWVKPFADLSAWEQVMGGEWSGPLNAVCGEDWTVWRQPPPGPTERAHAREEAQR